MFLSMKKRNVISFILGMFIGLLLFVACLLVFLLWVYMGLARERENDLEKNKTMTSLHLEQKNNYQKKS